MTNRTTAPCRRTGGTGTARTTTALLAPLLVVLGAACTAATTVDPAQRRDAAGAITGPATVPDTRPDREPDISPPDSDPKEQRPTVTTTTSTATTTTATVTTVTTAGGTGAESSATVSTDAGQIRARYAAGELDVEVDSAPGWTPVVHRVSPTRIEVEWTSARGVVRTELAAGEGGISATTRSVAAG